MAEDDSDEDSSRGKRAGEGGYIGIFGGDIDIGDDAEIIARGGDYIEDERKHLAVRVGDWMKSLIRTRL